MKTDDLITALSRQTPAVPARTTERRLALTALFVVLAAAVVLRLFFGLRPDLAEASTAATLKALFGLAMAAATAPLVLSSARPAGRLGRAFIPILALAALAAVGSATFVALMPEGQRAATFFQGFPPCLRQLPLIALPGLAIALLAFRSLAPTRLAHAGAAAGATAGALSVVIYALHCPIDEPGYVLAWYPVAVALCAGVGALLGPRLLRW